METYRGCFYYYHIEDDWPKRKNRIATVFEKDSPIKKTNYNKLKYY